MIPSVSVKKSLVGGAPALQSTQGILAIIASASSIPSPSIPVMLTNQGLTTSTFGSGMLPECAVYQINTASQPVVALAVDPTITGSYYAGTLVRNVLGSCVVTTGATHPYLHYDVIVTIVNGGTIGVTGITFTYSLDGGNVTSAITALGTLNVLTIPASGVSFALAAGTLLAGDNFSVFTERPLLNNADIAASLVTLGNTKLPWEGVLIDSNYVTGTVSVVDTWLAGREANGQFNFALLNTRFLLEPCPTAEAPATYAASISAQSGTDTSNRICLCADGGRMTSLITGNTTKFPASLALAGQTMAVTPNIGIDPAYVALGPVEGFSISSAGSPLDWDEFLYQSLDSQRLTTLRTFAAGGATGTFVTNANVLISAGSNIYWLQLLRVLNKSCGIAWQVLNAQLSRGVQTIYNATTGKLNIKPTAAQTIEALVNTPLKSGLSGQVTDVAFSLNRDDDMSQPNAPINGQVAIAPLVYLKSIVVTAALVRTISVPKGGV